MRGDPYTQSPMEPARAGTDARDSRFDGLHAEAKAAVGYSANTLRSVRERYREAYSDSLDRLAGAARRARCRRIAAPTISPGRDPRRPRWTAPRTPPRQAPTTSGDGRCAATSRRLTIDLGERQSELAKLELAERSLERTWLFLERGDATLITEVGPPASEGDAQMRIVEAQEAERSRLAQEVHDGPAQALANSIFQVEYIERVIESDPLLARTELRFLRELLRRELGDVRAFISQLRPPMLDQLGLDGAIDDTVEHMRALTGLEITTDLGASADGLNDAQRTVALRVAQEALQNVRKHAAATKVTVATHDEQAGEWVLEVRDDGRGFDVGAVAARGRRNFGLQFMRERAELIGARFDVRSRPDGGTVVRLTIPTGDAIGRRGEHMTGIDYSGPERRRGGPDRRALDDVTRILVVDDHALFRMGIANILGHEPDFEIVAEAEDSRGAIDRALETSPDIILMDLSLPAPGGIETTQRIKRELPSTGIIVLAQTEDEDALFDAIKAGAAAFILKDVGPDDLVTIIRRVVAGEYLINDKVFSKPAVASRVLKEFRELAVYGQDAAPIFAPLSPREVEILDNIAQGMTNKQVAYALSISEQTVKNHMSSILRKLSVNDRTQAVVYAMRQGWIRMPED